MTPLKILILITGLLFSSFGLGMEGGAAASAVSEPSKLAKRRVRFNPEATIKWFYQAHSVDQIICAEEKEPTQKPGGKQQANGKFEFDLELCFMEFFDQEGCTNHLESMKTKEDYDTIIKILCHLDLLIERITQKGSSLLLWPGCGHGLGRKKFVLDQKFLLFLKGYRLPLRFHAARIQQVLATKKSCS